MKAGFAKIDITPRVGVELCGFGPFIQRRSVGVRDRLWAKAAAFEQNGTTLVLVSCDLIGLSPSIVRRVREVVREATGLKPEAVMVHCTHTHSGPCAAEYHGWGEPDPPYLEILPQRIARACVAAVGKLQEAALAYAEVPCEGIGLNREYDSIGGPIEAVLGDDWRPTKPELTDTTCHVLTLRKPDGDLMGFLSYFGCHPVVCCHLTRYIHGDFAGVASNMIEAENPGSVGLFLQGAQGDVNTCWAHRPEKESLAALDVIAARYARAVRSGMAAAEPTDIDSVSSAQRMTRFSRRVPSLEALRRMLEQDLALLRAPDASDEDPEVRMAAVRAIAIRERMAALGSGQPPDPPVELHGFRLGPISLLGAPLEIFQAIKNDARNGAKSPVTLVMGITNGDIGYAPDRTAASRGGYAADVVPMIVGEFPFADIHAELVSELLGLEKGLR